MSLSAKQNPNRCSNAPIMLPSLLAIQFNGKNRNDLKQWNIKVIACNSKSMIIRIGEPPANTCVNWLDWIVKTPSGEILVFSDSEFRLKYEPNKRSKTNINL